MKKVGSDSTVFSSLDKIQNLLQKGTLDELTKLVLVNAIYFKGSWEEKFKATSTRDTQFKLNQVRPQIEQSLCSFLSTSLHKSVINPIHIILVLSSRMRASQ